MALRNGIYKIYAINQNGTEKWSFIINGSTHSSPAIGSDGTIYIGTIDNNLYAINPDGTEKWNFITGGEVFSSPAIGSNGIVYFGSYDNKLYAINPDGTEKWSFITGGDIWSSPAIGSDGVIYIGSNDGKLYAINPDGTQKWNMTIGPWVISSPAIGSDGTIYVGSGDNNCYAIYPDGTEKWRYVTGNAIISSPAIDSDGTIYIGSRDYYLHAIGESGTPPIANAGSDQTVKEGDLVQFMGCGSYDLDGSYSVNVERNYPLTSDDYNQYYPSFHPDGSKILYVSNEDGDPFWDIWIMDADGSNRTQLTFEECNQASPTYNSDGSKILYASGEDGGSDYDIWIMDADGSNRVQLTFEDYTQLHPSFSPDDTKITYISWEFNMTFNVWIMDADGTNQTQLTNDIFFDFIYGGGYTVLYIARNPIFTRDGERIIYESTEDGLSISDLWIIDLDGSNRTQLTFENFSQVMPHINKCGNLITYSSNEGPNKNPCIWLMDEKGNNHRQLINDSYFSTYPRFSPDGTKIVYCLSNNIYGPNNLWILELDIDNKTLEYFWDFDANVDSDSDGNFTNDVDATGPTPTHIYGDDGIYVVTLMVTDSDGLSATDTCNITVLNVDPMVEIESATMNAEIGLRVAGRKFNDVEMTLFEDGTNIGHVSIERLPGSPNEQMAWIPITLDLTKTYSAMVTYTPEDPPNIGANPVWIYIKSENGSINKIHHTFNVQQSKKRDSDHWNHVEPWEVDLNPYFIGFSFEITTHITDPGSDDESLTYSYGTQIVTAEYLNNPPISDLYPSPEVNPRDIIDTTTLVYEGPGTITVIARDDDNIRLGIGEGSDSIDLV
jgi:Tol biopolymer transport system component